MTKINIISGFLGAGKTTLIKKLLKEAEFPERLIANYSEKLFLDYVPKAGAGT